MQPYYMFRECNFLIIIYRLMVLHNIVCNLFDQFSLDARQNAHLLMVNIVFTFYK